MSFSLFTVAIKNLKRKTFRTGVLIVSIGLLVSILVFGTSFIISVTSSIGRASDRLGADVLVVPMGAREAAEEVLLETKSKSFYMPRNMVDRVIQVEGVDRVTTQTYLTTILGVCCDVPAAKVVAFDQDTDFIVKPWLKELLGRPLKPHEAIIGWVANENLGLLDVERSILFGTDFKYVGELDKTGTGLDNAILITSDNIPDIIEKGASQLKPNEISVIFVKVKPGYDPYKVGRDIENEIVEVDVTMRSDMGKDIIATLKDIKSVFVITILLATLLSVFLTWTIFSAIVNERIKEIAIMRAIGAKESHVLKVFIIEVVVLGLIGSVAGITLGTYMSISLSKLFTLLRNLSATLTIMERTEIGLLGIIIGTSICLVGALSPVMKIKKMEPLSAIKEA